METMTMPVEQNVDEQFEKFAAWAKAQQISPSGASTPVVGRSLGELLRPVAGDPNELLRHRYLCRGGGLLMVGPTGIGKSSLSMQFMMLWALGREAFGIQPAMPLKSLLIQAENDDGDLAEMRDGVCRGLKLSDEDAQVAFNNIIVSREDALMAEAFFQQRVIPLVEHHQPHLLWIDPVLAYLGGEANSQKDVGRFVRNLLNPVLNRFGCACVLVHHTNKPPVGQEKSNWQGSDFAYLGSGSAEWANWARAVVALRSVGSHSVFELRAGKRGSRLGWRSADGETRAYSRYIAHADEPGVICWREVEADDVPSEEPETKRVATKDDILPHVPVDKAISKEALRSKANQAGIALNKINGLIAELIEDGRLHEWRVRRKGTNPQRLIARFKQPELELGS